LSFEFFLAVALFEGFSPLRVLTMADEMGKEGASCSLSRVQTIITYHKVAVVELNINKVPILDLKTLLLLLLSGGQPGSERG
jgi:hypothetical protein